MQKEQVSMALNLPQPDVQKIQKILRPLIPIIYEKRMAK